MKKGYLALSLALSIVFIGCGGGGGGDDGSSSTVTVDEPQETTSSSNIVIINNNSSAKTTQPTVVDNSGVALYMPSLSTNEAVNPFDENDIN